MNDKEIEAAFLASDEVKKYGMAYFDLHKHVFKLGAAHGIESVNAVSAISFVERIEKLQAELAERDETIEELRTCVEEYKQFRLDMSDVTRELSSSIEDEFTKYLADINSKTGESRK